MIVLVLISIVMSRARDDIYENLVDWLGNENDVSKIKIVELSPGQRIIIANQDLQVLSFFIQEGEEFIQIDNSFVISQEFVKSESLINKEIIEKGLQIDRNLIFTIMFMLEESTNPSSTWMPYLNTLPEYFEDFPQLYSEDLLNLLKGYSIYQQIQDDKNEWAAEYELLQSNSEFFRGGNYSYDDYIYWRVVLMSRAFNIGGDALIPYADMLNDHPNGFVRGYLTDTYFGMQVTKDVKEGEEILFRYINQGNEYYLLHYGYVSEGNYINTFEFTQCLDSNDPLYKAKFRMFQNYDCWAGLLVNSTLFKEEVLSFARLTTASTVEELLEIQLQQQSAAFDPLSVQFISAYNEGLAIISLLNLLQDTITELPTTIEEDQRIIDDPNSHYVRKYIAIYTKLQKLVLKQTIDDLTYIKHLMDNPTYVCILIIQDLNSETESLQHQRIKDYFMRGIVDQVTHEDL